MKKMIVPLVGALVAFTSLDAVAKTERVNGYVWVYDVIDDRWAANYNSVVVSGTDQYYGKVTGDITIPSTLGGKPVKCIAEKAFKGCQEISSVIIPDGVTKIERSAFYECTGLTSITIPASVKSIGEYAFSRCRRLKSVHITDIAAWCGISFDDSANPLVFANLYHNGAIVEDLTIPNGVKSIGRGAFYEYKGLKSVTIPGSVWSIGEDAFSFCGNITKVKIGNGVSVIGKNAFYSCKSLKSIVIPDGVREVGTWAFLGCSGLTSLTIGKGQKSIEKEVFSGCSGLTSVTIPDGVEFIGFGAFKDCSGLKSVTIPASVTKIFDGMTWGGMLPDSTPFYGVCNVETLTTPIFPCGMSKSSIKHLTIPNGVTSIADGEFEGCTGLISITIPEGVTSIGSRAFAGCSNLTKVKIPKSVTSIDNTAFSGCSKLKKIPMPSR